VKNIDYAGCHYSWMEILFAKVAWLSVPLRLIVPFPFTEPAVIFPPKASVPSKDKLPIVIAGPE
jgi:hypothetical protein